MNPLRQLIRKPVTTVVVLLLLCLTSSFFCIGFGLIQSVLATADKINENYVTIALPTQKTETVEIDMGNGRTTSFEQSVITPEIWEYISSLPDACDAVKGAYQQEYISAWSPDIVTLTSAKEAGHYKWYLNNPYNNACFVVTLTEIGSFDFSIPGKVYVKLTTQVRDTVFLHQDYTERNTLYLHCTFSSMEELEQLNLKVGSSYIVYGFDYIDNDLELRTDLASVLKIPLSAIDYTQISYDVTEWFPGENGYVAVYKTGDRVLGLDLQDVESIEAATLFVNNQDKGYFGDYYPTGIDGTKGTTSTAILNAIPTIAPLDGTIDEFLLSNVGVLWSSCLEQAAVRNQSVPIIGTDMIESMLTFQQNDAYIVEGRAFDDSEYYTGDKVCIISEALALASGLTTGDTISLSFFWGADPHLEIEEQESGNITAQNYVSGVGACGGSQQFVIVGIYRLVDMWNQSSYAFTPNTVFVPNASLEFPTYSGRNGIYYTLVIENGRIDEVKAALKNKGYNDDLLMYYDGGYGTIGNTLDSFKQDVFQIFYASVITWMIAIGAYVVFFVYGQRKHIGLMLSLGAGKKDSKKYLLLYSFIPVIVSSIVGVVASVVLLENILIEMYTSSKDMVETAFSITSIGGNDVIGSQLVVLPWMGPLAACVQIVIMIITISFVVNCMCKKDPRVLLSK